ncbi:hypothetical protein Pcinc_040818 [Petrolisthes cinctipes]|uniref:Uncharacterized protein n=1 Tax=Petrolisthes cinctipes TaxID=88211 RepID=A0AAE1BM51_PETCI|nr:hypothetical protein Pcinc_040818 [Petrolisthes cinctipes]
MASHSDGDSSGGGGGSSVNLSLRLRSSDSKDSFYMDLDRGIDSDIEEVSSAPPRAVRFKNPNALMQDVGGAGEIIGSSLAPQGTHINHQERTLLVQRVEDREGRSPKRGEGWEEKAGGEYMVV